MAYVAVVTLYALGWLFLFYATFLVDHLDLFGLAQAWRRWAGGTYREPEFHARGVYGFVRHPIYIGWLLIVWAAPTMTIAHLVFAFGSTIYILAGIWFEERDLVEAFGERYVEYRHRTPMLLPRIFR